MANSVAVICVDSNDWTGVVRAAGDLQADIARVTGKTPAILIGGKVSGANIVLVGTLGKGGILFKQWGGVRKSATGRELDGRSYDAYPAHVTAEAPSLVDRRSVWQKLETDLAIA